MQGRSQTLGGQFGDVDLNQSFPARGAEQSSQLQLLAVEKSAYKLLSLSTIAKLCAVAERHPAALRYFPAGSRLSLGAGGESGDYQTSSSIYLTCSLILPSGETVGKEHISSREPSRLDAFERFLEELENKAGSSQL